MKEMIERNRISIACALVAVSVAGLAAGNIAASYEFRVSSLVRMAVDDPIARVAVREEPRFVLFSGGSHYDGIYFYAIARDPFALGEEHTLIDLPGARYGHPLYAWLVGLVSLGQPRLIPNAMLLVNLVAIMILAVAVSALAHHFGWSRWAGLIVAMNPGLIYAATVDTTEIVGNLMMVLALLAWFKRRLGVAAIFLVAMCLSKETYALVAGALFLWELLEWWRGRPAPDMWKRLVLLSLGPTVFIAWEIWLRYALGYWAFRDHLNVFSLPLVGWAETMIMSGVANNGIDFNRFQIESAVTPILLPIAVAMVAALIRAGKLRSPIDLILIVMIILNFSLGWLNLFYVKDLIRQLSTLFLLLPYAFVGIKAGAPYLQDRLRTEEPLTLA